MENTMHSLSARLSKAARRSYTGKILALLLPVDRLVPDCYAQWRPLVRGAVGFIGASLSEERLIPKLVEQLMFPREVSLEKRLAAFIARMPSLQKLGQTIARNRHLNPEFRAELLLLENMIRDVSPEQIQERIHQLLGRRMETYSVELEGIIHAEASVSAVLRFSWFNAASDRREQGVFKVLKPYIPEFYREELEILRGLPNHLMESSPGHHFTEIDFHKIFNDIVRLMEREIDTVNEQSNLVKAGRRYHNIPGIRVPGFISELSVPGITAMSLELGNKVTEVFINEPAQRNQLAQRIVEAMVAVPLFSPDDQAEFHADPHAGNLYFDEDRDDLVIFDWALTETLDREERRHITLLISAVMLRDEYLIFSILEKLCGDSLSGQTGARVKARICHFTLGLSPLTLPGLKHLLALLDEVFRIGINFPSALLVFRKVLLTLDGILHDLDLKLPMENVLTAYLLGGNNGRLRFDAYSPGAPFIRLSNTDMWSLWCSASWLGLRIGVQTGTRLFREQPTTGPA